MMAYSLPITPFEFKVVNTFVHVDDSIYSPRAVPLPRHASCPALVQLELASQIVAGAGHRETRHGDASVQPQSASESAPILAQRKTLQASLPVPRSDLPAVRKTLHLEDKEEAFRTHAVFSPISKPSCTVEGQRGCHPDDHVSTDDGDQTDSLDGCPSGICDGKVHERSSSCEDMSQAGSCECPTIGERHAFVGSITPSESGECEDRLGAQSHLAASDSESSNVKGIEKEIMTWAEVVRRGSRAKGTAQVMTPGSPTPVVTPASPTASSPPSRASIAARSWEPAMSHNNNLPKAGAKKQPRASPRHSQQHAQELSRTIPVGLQDDGSFHVMKRLLGPCGQRLRSIVTEAGDGVRIAVQGRGSSSAPTAISIDNGPLTILVTSEGTRADEKMCKAVRLVEGLLKDVHKEYNSFVSRRQQYAGYQSATVRSTAGSRQGRQRLFKCRYIVGIDDDPDFRVVHRLLGPGAKNQKRIIEEARRSSDECDVTLSIIGKGSGRGGSGSGPLAIAVSATSQAAVQNAANLVEELLAEVYEQRRRFCRERNFAAPALVIRRETLAASM